MRVSPHSKDIVKLLMSVGMKEYQADFIGLNLPHIHPVGIADYSDFCVASDLIPYIELYHTCGTDYAGMSLSEFIKRVTNNE